MPAKEIKELRQAGKLVEAYAMAKSELEADFSNIWGKRNLSWVLYSQLNELSANLDAFIAKINEVKQLNLPPSEEIFFDNISIVIAKAARFITREARPDINKIHRLFDSVKDLPIKRNSPWYSVLFKAMHKGMKESNRYIEFADWWDFKNLRSEDYLEEEFKGKKVISIAEQAYITYAKHLLPKQTQAGEIIFDEEKVKAFLPALSKILENYPQFQYPSYFYAKLLLALGQKDNLLEHLLPFARKKCNDFWVWEIMGEAFANEPEKVLACYCKALTCYSPEQMLVGLRQKMARILLGQERINEAKTEIELLVKARLSHEYKIPFEVSKWIDAEWYKTAASLESNIGLYKEYAPIAESLLFTDIPEELVIVDYVNTDRKILNFIASENKFGAFKYDRFFNKVRIGDILKVRFKSGIKGGFYQVYSATVTTDEHFKNKFLRSISGIVKIPNGKNFGFIDDVFITPAYVSKYKLFDGAAYTGIAIKNYNSEKKIWRWKLHEK